MPKSLLIYTDSPVRGRSAACRRYLQEMAFLNCFRRGQAAEQAVALAEMLAGVPEGRRAVHPFYLLGFEMKVEEYPVDAVGIYERGVIDSPGDVRTLGLLAEQLDRRGIALDLIYCDTEHDISLWTLGFERLRAVYRSEKALERMPPEARGFDLERMTLMSRECQQWLDAFGPYAQRIKIESIRKALIDAGLLPIFGDRTSAVNFYAIRTSFPVYDLNGWKLEWQTLVDTRTSCPVCTPAGQGQRYAGREHHRLWNALIDTLNHARSSAACGPLVPVIREPFRARGQAAGTVDPGAAWLAEQLVGHLVRAGADRFMMFHAHATEADDQMYAEIASRHENAIPGSLPTLPEIRLDVDEIVTGDFRTTYSDFLAREPDRWEFQT